jgi:hypothetical protein
VLAQGEDWNSSPTSPWGPKNPWETAPIHLMQLLSPDLQSTGWGDDGTGVCMVTWAGYGRLAPPTPELLTYPGNGSRWLYASEQAAEWPFTPGEFVGLPEGTTTGPYLYVFGYGTDGGAITAASLTGPTGPLAVRTVDNHTASSTQTLGDYLPAGGIIIPVRPLRAGATYTARVVFAPDAAYGSQTPSAPLSLTWSFSVHGNQVSLDDTFWAGNVSADSNSPAPITVNVTRLPSQTRVRRLTLKPGSMVYLHLAGARYRACFTQPATGEYAAAGPDCQQSTWGSDPGLKLGKPWRKGGRWLVVLTANRLAAGAKGTVRVEVPTTDCSNGVFCVPSFKTVYRRSFKLAARQRLSFPAQTLDFVEVDVRSSRHGEFLCYGGGVRTPVR